MIQFLYDITTGLVTLAQPGVIRFGLQVPCTLTFSASPGAVSSIQLALGLDSSAPTVLAYTEAWTQVNATTWSAVLDASDTRLGTALSGSALLAVNAEMDVTIDGVAQSAPNVQLTVQPRIISGPTTSDGGPTYYTEGQVDAAIAAALAAAGQNATGTVAIAGSSGDVLFSYAGPNRNFIGNATVAAGSAAFTAKLVLQSGNRMSGDRIDLQIPVPASANPTIQIYDTTDSGTLLGTLAGDATTARTYLMTAYFNGTNWVLFSLTQQI